MIKYLESKKNVKKYAKIRKLKPQPGAWASRNNSFASLINSNNVKKIKHEDNNYLCPVMKDKIILDNLSKDGKPLVTPTPFDKKCDNGFYKGFLTLDSGVSQKMPKGHTYHFFRQDNSGFWSHKPGTLPVENIDADNKPIVAPHLAEKIIIKIKNLMELTMMLIVLISVFLIINTERLKPIKQYSIL